MCFPSRSRPDKALLQDLTSPLVAGPLLDEREPTSFIKMPGRIEPSKGPKMGFDECPSVYEVQCCRQQLSPSAGATYAIIDDEPAQMGDALPQIFSVDCDRSDDLPVSQNCPDRILRIVQSATELSETTRHDALELLSEARCPGVVERAFA